MRRATPPDLQREEQLWRRVHDRMHATLERVFNDITEAAAAAEVELPLGELRQQLLDRVAPALADAWPGGWDVWDGVCASVLSTLRRVLV